MPSAHPLQPGDPPRLGPYEIIGRLGEGGQSVVYLGRGPSGAPVAVKLLHARLFADRMARDGFIREMELAKRVARFCTAQVLDADVAGERPYLVSEYIPGPSLQRLVEEQGPRTGGALERLAIATATALAAIHKTGIVHRDLKPHNVQMGPDGPRVIDFGIAKMIQTASAMPSQVVGTPTFMAPEQLSGRELSSATDVFAWGGTIVYAATGRPPFGADEIWTVVNRIKTEPPQLGNLSGPLRELVTAALEKDPARRPTARQILLRLIGDEHPEASGGNIDTLTRAANRLVGAPPFDQGPVAARPPLKVVAAALGVALVLVGGLAAWAVSGRSADAQPKTSSGALPADAVSAQAAAREYMPQVASYDFGAIDSNITQARTRMTGKFGAKYADLVHKNIAPQAKQTQTKVTASVTEAGVISVEPGKVRVLVFMALTTVSAGHPQGQLSGRSSNVTLVREGDRWLIDEAEVQ